jgi:hypothetical protein
MRKRPALSVSRAAEIWTTLLSARREFFDDSRFFKMPEVWEELCGVSEEWSIKTYRSDEKEDFRRKAGLLVFGDRLTLTVDEVLIEKAMQGCKLCNFILAHEFGHLALNHHAKSAVTKHFQLFDSPYGMANLPPNLQELVANYAAVFFQCGAALAEDRWSPSNCHTELALTLNMSRRRSRFCVSTSSSAN